MLILRIVILIFIKNIKRIYFNHLFDYLEVILFDSS